MSSRDSLLVRLGCRTIGAVVVSSSLVKGTVLGRAGARTRRDRKGYA